MEKKFVVYTFFYKMSEELLDWQYFRFRIKIYENIAAIKPAKQILKKCFIEYFFKFSEGLPLYINYEY